MYRLHSFKNMVRPSAHADDNACMLYGIIFIQQQTAYHTHALQNGFFRQTFHPVGCQYLHIIVQKYKNLSGCFPHTVVIQL